MTTSYAQTECAMCGKQDYCRSLHGDKGGPIQRHGLMRYRSVTYQQRTKREEPQQ
jgi:hypothetical protein